MIFMAVAAISLGICQADVKDVKILNTAKQEIGSHDNVTSISFADGKMTVHAPEGNGVYDLSEISALSVGNGGSTGLLTDITSDLALVASVSNGVLSMSCAEEIQKVDVYSATGLNLASGKFNANEVEMKVNSDYPVLIVKVSTAGASKVIKLINR